jgi:hypothetical protein
MQQPLAHTRSHHMTHSSTFPRAYARSTLARAFPGMGALSARTKPLLVKMLSLILAWKLRLAMLLGKVVTVLWPAFGRM